MADSTREQQKTRELRLAERAGVGALVLIVLSRLAARMLPGLETPLLIGALAAFALSFYWRAVDPGPARRAGDGA